MVWLVTGAGGQLGSVLLRGLVVRGVPALGVASRSGPLPLVGEARRADVSDPAALAELFHAERPTVVVHAVAVASVAAAHADPAAALRVNAGSTRELAALCARAKARLVYVSTDMVFDGEGAPYEESAATAPLSEYGRSKREGELAALAVPGSLVVRLPLMYGAPFASRPSTFLEQVRALREGRPLTLFHDEWRTPLWLEDAAHSVVLAAESDVTGVLHVGGPERLSRLEMGVLLANALGVKEPRLESVSRTAIPSPEPRARDLSLDSRRFTSIFGVAPGRPMREALVEMRLA